MADGDLKPPPRPVLPETPMLGVENTDRQSVEAMRYGLASAGPLAQAVLTNNPAALAAALPVGLIDSPRRCTSTTRPSDPTQGQFIFELDTMSLRFWSGTAWVGLPASGSIQAYAGITPPVGWLLCSGQSISRSGFPDLFSALSISFVGATTTSGSTTVSGLNNMASSDHVGWGIAGNGIPGGATIISVTNITTVVISAAATVTQTGTASLSLSPYGFDNANNTTTFRLPDLRGRVPAGRDNMGGSTAGLITFAGANIIGTILGAAGGSQTHNLSVSQMPSHSHGGATNLGTGPLELTDGRDLVYTNAAAGVGTFGTAPGPSNLQVQPHAHGINAEGGSAAHQNTQPTIISNYIIKS